VNRIRSKATKATHTENEDLWAPLLLKEKLAGKFLVVHRPRHKQQIDWKKPNEDRSLGALGE
jgi:hypothetical protein